MITNLAQPVNQRQATDQGLYIEAESLNQDGPDRSQTDQSHPQTVRNGLITRDGSAGPFGTDIIISAEDNPHPVIEVSLLTDQD